MSDKIITEGSLCTGYDGIGMGLRLAGLNLETRFHVENAEAPASVLKHETPDVPNLRDLKAANFLAAPRVELLASGDPCQSISIAGRKEGRNDPRFLWPWVRDAYRALSPDRILFENVTGIVRHDDGRTLAERFEHLRADGYAVRWTVIGACAVGAPHHRHRWFALATKVGANAPEAVRVGGSKEICGAPRSGGRILLPTPRATDGPNGGPNQRNGRGGYDALPGAVVNLLPTPRAADGSAGPGRGGKLQGGDDLRTTVVRQEWGKFTEAIKLWEQVTGVPAPVPTEPNSNGGRRLNPALAEWMMGLRPGLLTDHLTRSEALIAAGNGVVPQVVPAAWKILTED